MQRGLGELSFWNLAGWGGSQEQLALLTSALETNKAIQKEGHSAAVQCMLGIKENSVSRSWIEGWVIVLKYKIIKNSGAGKTVGRDLARHFCVAGV